MTQLGDVGLSGQQWDKDLDNTYIKPVWGNIGDCLALPTKPDDILARR